MAQHIFRVVRNLHCMFVFKAQSCRLRAGHHCCQVSDIPGFNRPAREGVAGLGKKFFTQIFLNLAEPRICHQRAIAIFLQLHFRKGGCIPL